jgi:hypothetical protein
MPDDNPTEWVLPSSIPFDQLKSKDLEECVYWLLDAMGGQNLEWRTGGSGQGASDGGRDLEATFYAPGADAEMAGQLWWIECKGRKGTVEPDAVKSAALNAQAKEGLTRLIVATNTQFSNPTRDWVKEWQKKYPSPVVDLWDRATLERYLSQHPQVVLRLFSEALSPTGRARAMQTRFWNRFEYVPVKTLNDLWKDRETISFEGMDIFAAIANEFAHGDIAARPWGAILAGKDALEVLVNALHNLAYLMMRASTAGADMTPVAKSLAYLILTLLEVLPADVVTKFIEDSVYRGKKDEWPENVREMVLMPVVDQLLSEMTDICTSDCRRLFGSTRQALSSGEDEIERYWRRFNPASASEKEDRRFLWIERNDGPCVVGFSVNAEQGCPLIHTKPTVHNVEELLGIVKRVAAYRKAEASQKLEAERLRETQTKPPQKA